MSHALYASGGEEMCFADFVNLQNTPMSTLSLPRLTISKAERKA